MKMKSLSLYDNFKDAEIAFFSWVKFEFTLFAEFIMCTLMHVQ